MNTTTKTAIVIPARYQSGRLPGKPLKLIAGTTMIERVWRIASSVSGISKVLIATDDQRIFDAATAFGADVVMTPISCKNGSERVYAAIKGMQEGISAVINLQGDAPLTQPSVLAELVAALNQMSQGVVTPAVRLTMQQYEHLKLQQIQGGRTGTFVTFSATGDALYFSRSLIPAIRVWANDQNFSPVYQHIGIYGYTLSALEDYLNLPEGNLEKIEGLEQLRLLEHGRKIKVIPVDLNGRSHWSVDNETDIEAVEAIIKREGEIL